jgi:hypothetical protein
MFNFANLKLVKESADYKNSFIGIRKSNSGDDLEFCLPIGFDNFPENDYNEVRNLFFMMYRTFRKFADDADASRVKRNEEKYQFSQDQITLSDNGKIIQNAEGEECVIYSKIKMIEQVLDAYDEFAIYSIQNKIRRSEEINYSQIHKYLDRAIYLDDDVIYIDAMNLPRPTLRYESTDIVNLYCYILNEIVLQLDDDVPNNIKTRIQDIRFSSQRFKDDYLTNNQSIFDKDTFVETINILKESLDKIDNNTYYKDSDYWGLYEAIETFLYGEINPKQNDGNYWGIQKFSLVWEDMCNTYFFKKRRQDICYADTDICLPDYINSKRDKEQQNRVGNCQCRNKWIYSVESDIYKKDKKPTSEKFSWYEVLSMKFNTKERVRISISGHLEDESTRHKAQVKTRFFKPDLILKSNSHLEIIDYKYKSLKFYINHQNSLEKTDDLLKMDIIQQLTYELAIQLASNDYQVSSNLCFIPYYYSPYEKLDDELGEIENQFDFRGISIFKANFNFIQMTYLENNL